MRLYSCAAYAEYPGGAKVYALWMLADSKEHAIKKATADVERRFPASEGYWNHMAAATIIAKADVLSMLERYDDWT